MSVCSNVIMWILVIIMVIGLLMTFRNLNDKNCVSKYEGICLTILGLVSSCFVGVFTN